ncbi:MAG: hypothetical protein ACYS32_13620 [Planctomycetota bacterium]|jgi:hypothetical protein
MGKKHKKKPGRQQPEGQRKFNQQQYDMLKRCSDKKDMTEWNQYRYEKPEKKVLLAGVDFSGAHLENAAVSHANALRIRSAARWSRLLLPFGNIGDHPYLLSRGRLEEDRRFVRG